MKSNRHSPPAGSAKFVFVAAMLLAGASPLLQSAPRSPTADPWRSDDVITPKQLADSLGKTPKSEIVCVGFDFLFKAGHVPGAWFRGPASQPKGLANLKAWAQKLDRKREIVLYCGCCPWKQCPNIRPAYAALKAMGFTHLKVVEIEKDFPTDWTGQGFPAEKGS